MPEPPSSSSIAPRRKAQRGLRFALVDKGLATAPERWGLKENVMKNFYFADRAPTKQEARRRAAVTAAHAQRMGVSVETLTFLARVAREVPFAERREGFREWIKSLPGGVKESEGGVSSIPYSHGYGDGLCFEAFVSAARASGLRPSVVRRYRRVGCRDDWEFENYQLLAGRGCASIRMDWLFESIQEWARENGVPLGWVS